MQSVSQTQIPRTSAPFGCKQTQLNGRNVFGNRHCVPLGHWSLQMGDKQWGFRDDLTFVQECMAQSHTGMANVSLVVRVVLENEKWFSFKATHHLWIILKSTIISRSDPWAHLQLMNSKLYLGTILLCWTLTWKKIRPCAKDCWMSWKEVRLFKNFLALDDVVFPFFRGWIPRLPTSPANDVHRVCDWLLCQQAQRNYRRSVGRSQICGDLYGQRGNPMESK